jgi:hypothetical protein
VISTIAAFSKLKAAVGSAAHGAATLEIQGAVRPGGGVGRLRPPGPRPDLLILVQHAPSSFRTRPQIGSRNGTKKRASSESPQKAGSSTLDVHCGIAVADGSRTFGLLPDADVRRKAEGPAS